MYLLHRAGGFPAQQALWKLRSRQRLILHDLTAVEIDQMAALMTRYRDTPMDLADASLMAVAEGHRRRQLFTLDSDFFAYRLADGSSIEILS